MTKPVKPAETPLIEGGFVWVTDLLHPGYPDEEYPVFGRVGRIDGDTIQIIMPRSLQFGLVIERKVDQIHPVRWDQVDVHSLGELGEYVSPQLKLITSLTSVSRSRR